MSETASKPEPYLPPKELGDALERQYSILGYGQRACRRLVRDMREAGGYQVIRKKYVRASEAARWICEHPDWEPFKKNRGCDNAGVLCVGP